MKSTIMSRRDLDFLLFEWLAVDDLVKRERFAEHSRETFSDVLDLCEELATRYFAPHKKQERLGWDPVEAWFNYAPGLRSLYFCGSTKHAEDITARFIAATPSATSAGSAIRQAPNRPSFTRSDGQPTLRLISS